MFFVIFPTEARTSIHIPSGLISPLRLEVGTSTRDHLGRESRYFSACSTEQFPGQGRLLVQPSQGPCPGPPPPQVVARGVGTLASTPKEGDGAKANRAMLGVVIAYCTVRNDQSVSLEPEHAVVRASELGLLVGGQ